MALRSQNQKCSLSSINWNYDLSEGPLSSWAIQLTTNGVSLLNTTFRSLAMLRRLFTVTVSLPVAVIWVLFHLPTGVLWHPLFPFHFSPGQAPRLNTHLDKETGGMLVIWRLSRGSMFVCEPSIGSQCLPLCTSYNDIFMLSSRAFGNGKQRFSLSWIQSREHGRMTSVNIQKIMASFNFQQKAYLSLKRLYQAFPFRAKRWTRSKSMTGNFLKMKGDCKFLE